MFNVSCYVGSLAMGIISYFRPDTKHLCTIYTYTLTGIFTGFIMRCMNEKTAVNFSYTDRGTLLIHFGNKMQLFSLIRFFFRIHGLMKLLECVRVLMKNKLKELNYYYRLC